MKIFIYTTLLLAFIFFSTSANAQTDKDKNYKKFYKSVNQNHGGVSVFNQKNIKDTDVIIETITAAELDSVMKNMTGVTDIIRGGKSLLHPVITLELDRTSSASQALFGCDEELDRTPDIGKGIPEPKIPGIATVKKNIASATKTSETVAPTTSTTKTGVTTPASASKPKTETKPAPTTKPATTGSSFKQFSDADWKLLRSIPVVLENQSDKAFLKKYSVVVGTFRSLNNAEFVKRTFNGLGEKTFILKNKNEGLYYAVSGSFDDDAVAVRHLEDFTKKYTEGQSKARRISRYGIPLDDLWVLINE